MLSMFSPVMPFMRDGLLEQVAELAFEQADNSGAPSAFREAAGRSRRSSACDPCRAGRERSCAFRWRTSRCGSARPSEIVSCPRAGIAGKRGQYIVPNRTSPYLAIRSGAVYGQTAFFLLTQRTSRASAKAHVRRRSHYHSNSALLRRPAAVVRNRRPVLDRPALRDPPSPARAPPIRGPLPGR